MPKAYVYTAHGDAAVEAFHDLPTPVPGPGELLVKVRAAGVNPVDWKRRKGYLPAGATAPALPAVAELLPERDRLITAADRATVARLGGSPVHRLRNRAVLETLAEWVVQGKLRPHVTDVFALPRAGEALRHVENGHARGKTVIAVAG